MKKLSYKTGLLVVLYFIWGINTFATEPLIPTDPNKKSEENDEDCYQDEIEEEGLEAFFSFLPGNEFYKSWDTTLVHYFNPEGFGVLDTALLKLVFDKNCDYHHPTDGHVTSCYGKRRKRFHYGIDLKLETGDPVSAAFEGLVRFAKYNRTYGNVVVIRHRNGLESYYAHLSELNVKPGDYVQAGDVIGLGGNTGRSYGAHLHFELRFLGVPFNPMDVICFEEKKIKTQGLYVIPAKTGGFKIETQERYHIVRPGDNLFKISNEQNVGLDKILELNSHLSDRCNLLVDSKIRIR